MKIWLKSLGLVCLVSTIALLVQAQGVGKSGETTPPGCAGKIKYRIVAQKNLIPPGQPGVSTTLTTWAEFRNEGDFDCKFVFCFMIDLKKKPETMNNITVGKNADGTWECIQSGTASSPPNFHFGCVQVSVPAHAGRGRPNDPPPVVAPFKNTDGSLKSVVQMKDMFTADELGTVYMDFLKDCPVSQGCKDLFCKANLFAVPKAPGDYPDWVNVWVGGSYFTLDEQIIARVDFPMGNWVTMGDKTSSYPGRLTGAVTGAPTGSRVTIFIPPNTTQEFMVTSSQPVCQGNPLQVSLPYLIPPDDGGEARPTITVALPQGQCGRLAEGQAIKFSGVVTATAGSPIYKAGDLMLGTDQTFIKDSRAPFLALRNLVATPDGKVNVLVKAGDTSSLPATVELTYTVNRGQPQVVPMPITESSIQGRGETNMVDFSSVLGPFPARAILDLQATITDEAGNKTTTSLGSATIPNALASVSAASFRGPELAADSIVAAFGAGLATRTEPATTIPLPTSLAGTTVEVADNRGTRRPAPLFFVSPGQVNYQLSPGTVNGVATITITSGDGTTSVGDVQIVSVAPGLFAANANGRGVAAASVLRVRADNTRSFEPVARFDAAQNRVVPIPIDLGPETDQLFLLLFGSGIRSRGALAGVTAQIGGISSEVLFAGAQGDFVGLDQVNTRLPRGLAGRGEVDVTLTVDGKMANPVNISVK